MKLFNLKFLSALCGLSLVFAACDDGSKDKKGDDIQEGDTNGGDEDTNGGDEDTNGGDEDTNGGDEDTNGGDEDTNGGDEDTNGGDEDTNGGDEDTNGGDEDTNGGDEDTNGGDSSCSEAYEIVEITEADYEYLEADEDYPESLEIIGFANEDDMFAVIFRASTEAESEYPESLPETGDILTIDNEDPNPNTCFNCVVFYLEDANYISTSGQIEVIDLDLEGESFKFKITNLVAEEYVSTDGYSFVEDGKGICADELELDLSL